jgi:hypothetical protein
MSGPFSQDQQLTLKSMGTTAGLSKKRKWETISKHDLPQMFQGRPLEEK